MKPDLPVMWSSWLFTFIGYSQIFEKDPCLLLATIQCNCNYYSMVFTNLEGRRLKIIPVTRIGFFYHQIQLLLQIRVIANTLGALFTPPSTQTYTPLYPMYVNPVDMSRNCTS